MACWRPRWCFTTTNPRRSFPRPPDQNQNQGRSSHDSEDDQARSPQGQGGCRGVGRRRDIDRGGSTEPCHRSGNHRVEMVQGALPVLRHRLFGHGRHQEWPCRGHPWGCESTGQSRAQLREGLFPVDMFEKEGRWQAFTAFLDDGRICLTNNAAERALRGVALGRKSWLFAGSERGGERAAAMYTVIVTAKMNGIDPQAWLADVLARLPDMPVARIHELLPWNWKSRPLAEAA